MGPKADKWYISRVLDGDTNAYSQLIDRYQDMVFTLACKMLRSHEDAEEMAQDVFVKAYQSLGTYRGTAKFSTWLYRITYNSCISQLRKNRPDTHSIDESSYLADEFAVAEDACEQMAAEERKRLLNQSLKKLDGEDEFLITLYYYEEKSMDELSEITGQTKNHVKVRLFRARKRLVSLLAQSQETKNIHLP